MGRNDEAETWLEEALGTCGAQDAVTLRTLVTVRVRNGNPKALNLLERLLREDPEDLALLKLKAQVLKERRRHEELIEVLEFLVLEDAASSEHMDDLLRLYEGLPLR